MSIPNRKVVNGWAMYDWANSVYNLVITTTFFPIYYLGVTKARTGTDEVTFMGKTLLASVLYDYTLSFAYLLIALSLPILSSIADTRGNKKNFLRFFCYLGALACASLFTFTSTSSLELGMLSVMLAAIGFWGGLVFYNSYLPEIAAPEYQDRVSARGFSFGYIGSVLMQLVGFALVTFTPFGITDAMAVRITFLLVGIWWFGFAQITFKRLPASKPAISNGSGRVLKDGFIELKKVYAQVRVMPVLKRFLRAFFFYSMGVQTVMMVAVIFASKELKLEATKLIICVVLIQLVAILGAWGMARLSGRFGNFKVLIATVLLWIGVCLGAYFITTEMQFYLLALAVGLVMGGIQSLSRSTYAKLLPETRDTASFFSYYDVTEKLAIAIGVFSFGYIEHITNNMRTSVLVLMGFFCVGLIWLFSALQKQRSLAGRKTQAAVYETGA
ncbi:MFS transporter [Chitinophaga alhagiae]|uniref:MFS transporter n=1 Tax=Chitinophaga alhagiae TaxID=2203219 RepID=A0ABM6WD09_9BACT|nr:MFS transporter [Chitinophaga alhagiae]AWO01953.1 MFS transporter [Chitinophaga alhagiae]